MRLAYSAQAASAQSGSLPLSATTWSLGTRLCLRLLFRSLGFAFLAHRLATPDLFQVVELAHRRMHDVHHYVAQVDQHPFAARLALYAVDARALLADALLHAVGERPHLGIRGAGRDHHPLEHRRQARGVEHLDVVAFHVLERFHDKALLGAQVHQMYSPWLAT